MCTGSRISTRRRPQGSWIDLASRFRELIKMRNSNEIEWLLQFGSSTIAIWMIGRRNERMVTHTRYLGDGSGISGWDWCTLQRRGWAWLRSERRHSLADAVRQYELFSQLDIRSSLGYSVLRARKLEGRRYRTYRRALRKRAWGHSTKNSIVVVFFFT